MALGNQDTSGEGEKVRLSLPVVSVKEKILLAVMSLAAVFLLFYNLDNQYLWQDEAQTALISKTILTKGIPLATDGLNNFSQELGRDYEKGTYIFKWHPWLSYYVTALSFKVLGVSTFSARFPHVLFGLFTIFLLYFFVRANTGSVQTAFLAVWLAMTSPAFFIMAKQCRYYSMIMFFTLLCVNEYLASVKGERRNFLGMAACLAALYYTQSVYAAITGAAILAHWLLYSRKSAVKIAAAFAGAVLACVPWLLYSRVEGFKEAYPNIMKLGNFIDFMPRYISGSVNQIYTLAAALIVSLYYVFSKSGNKLKEYSGIITLFVFYFAALMFCLSFFTVGVFFRYMSPLLILSPVFLAFLLFPMVKVKYVNIAVLLVLLLPLWQFKDYVYEITHDFNSPSKGFVGFLREKAKPGDIVAITYGDLPLKFYLDRVRIIGGLTGEDLSKEITQAKFVIFRKYYVALDRELAAYFRNNLNINDYKPWQINSPDTKYDNRENPSMHIYRTVKDEDNIVVWVKK